MDKYQGVKMRGFIVVFNNKADRAITYSHLPQHLGKYKNMFKFIVKLFMLCYLE